ncbi:MAG: arginase family protein [Myxococcota bacterium]
MEFSSLYGLDRALGTATVLVLPVPWEATTSYRRGTAAGPAAVARESVQVDLFDLDLERLGATAPITPRFAPAAEPHRAGIALGTVPPSWRAWADEASELARDIIADHDDTGRPRPDDDPALARVNALSAQLDGSLRQAIVDAEEEGRFVAVLGGDHSVAFASIAARAARYPGLGVLQFDAHADLRVAYQGFIGSHASVMHRVLAELPGVDKLVSVGVRDLCREEFAAIAAAGARVDAFFERDRVAHLHSGGAFATFAQRVVATLPRDVYVSFDIDGLDPRFCPHTGTPVPGGLSFDEAVAILTMVVSSGRRIVGLDLVEIAPGDDAADDGWDGNVGARLLYKLIGCGLLAAPGHVRSPA